MQRVIVLVGVSAEVGVIFDLLDREGEFRFAVGIRALPYAADVEVETLGGFCEDPVRRRFFVVRVIGYCRDIDVEGEGGNPAGAFCVGDVVAVELDEVGELVGHGSVPLFGLR